MEQDYNRLWRVRKTINEMLNDRGYIVTQEDLKMTLDLFKEKFADSSFSRDKLTMWANKKDDPTGADQIFVFFSDEPNLGVKSVRGYSEKMEQQKITRGIIVVQQGITPFAKTVLGALAPKVIIEQFQEAELLVNITEHVLVPQHSLLTEIEKADLLKRYKLKPTQLPRIQATDPIARYYGLSKSQVVKIVRPSETAGKYVTYRLVV